MSLGLVQLVLPRRYSFVPVIIAGCYMTLGQAIDIAGLNFYLLRILILFGVLRILITGEILGITLNGIDGVLLAGLLVNTFLFVLFDGTNVSLVGRLGAAYDAVGVYILVRASVRTVDDAIAVVQASAVIIIPLAVPFLMEFFSGRDPFAFLGGVPLFSEIRNGRVRCNGPFRHPILAGSFGATAMPLFVGLFGFGKARVVATLAIVSATIIVITSGSSGPLSAFVVASIGLLIWPLRNVMRPIRWGMLLALLGLDLVMKQPVWFLIARVSDLTGGGGWYRSALIDAAIRHFDEWWLIGTGYTAHWMPFTGNADEYSADLVNQFVVQGVSGGLLALLLFVWLIVKCFKTVGMARGTPGQSLGTQFMIWSMGCAFVGHVASFFSVSYFDQIIIFWYLLIGMIAAIVPRAMVVDAACTSKSPSIVGGRRLGHFNVDPSYGRGLTRAGGVFTLSQRPVQLNHRFRVDEG